MGNNRLEVLTIFILRVLIGWHLMYEGLVKLMDPEWTSMSFLLQSRGIMYGFSHWVVQNEEVLRIVDILNIWGLLLIGLGLILGLFTRISAWSGALLLLTYYLSNIPVIGIEPSKFQEGNYLLVNKTLIEAVALFLIGVLPAARNYALDLLFNRRVKHV